MAIGVPDGIYGTFDGIYDILGQPTRPFRLHRISHNCILQALWARFSFHVVDRLSSIIRPSGTHVSPFANPNFCSKIDAQEI